MELQGKALSYYYLNIVDKLDDMWLYISAILI